MPSAAVLSRFSRLAYVWERLQEAAHTVKQISDELFRARDSAESAWAYGNLATLREGMNDINWQAELLEALRTELLSLLTRGVLLCDEVAAAWAALNATIQGVQNRFEEIIPLLGEKCRSQPPTLAIMQPQPRALPAPEPLMSIAYSEHDWATSRYHLSLNIMGVKCPCPWLAGRGNSVLSLAVTAADAWPFLWSMQTVEVDAFDWGSTTRCHRGSRPARACGARRKGVTQSAVAAPCTRRQCGTPPPPPPRGSSRRPSCVYARVP